MQRGSPLSTRPQPAQAGNVQQRSTGICPGAAKVEHATWLHVEAVTAAPHRSPPSCKHSARQLPGPGTAAAPAAHLSVPGRSRSSASMSPTSFSHSPSPRCTSADCGALGGASRQRGVEGGQSSDAATRAGAAGGRARARCQHTQRVRLTLQPNSHCPIPSQPTTSGSWRHTKPPTIMACRCSGVTRTTSPKSR